MCTRAKPTSLATFLPYSYYCLARRTDCTDWNEDLLRFLCFKLSKSILSISLSKGSSFLLVYELASLKELASYSITGEFISTRITLGYADKGNVKLESQDRIDGRKGERKDINRN